LFITINAEEPFGPAKGDKAEPTQVVGVVVPLLFVLKQPVSHTVMPSDFIKLPNLPPDCNRLESFRHSFLHSFIWEIWTERFFVFRGGLVSGCKSSGETVFEITGRVGIKVKEGVIFVSGVFSVYTLIGRLKKGGKVRHGYLGIFPEFIKHKNRFLLSKELIFVETGFFGK